MVRPLRITRFANTALGLPLVALGVALFAIGAWWLAPVLVAAGGLVCLRGFRTRVLVEGETVTVHGYLWSRTIPRRSVNALTLLPALRWTSRSGGSRWTPLLMFMDSGRTLAFVRAHNMRCLGLLGEQLGVPAVLPTRRPRKGRPAEGPP